MIGIYQDNFKDYLEKYLGKKPKISSKNIIIPCPWCEYLKDKDHYHLYISLESPIFHCFHAGCEQKGIISKLLKKIEGRDSSDKFIDKEKVKEFQIKESTFTKSKSKKIIIPELKEDNFKLKSLYLKGRLKYSNPDLKLIKGLIFDVNEFVRVNQINDKSLERIQSYLHSNFIGFLTENESVIFFRNIDESNDFKHFKFFMKETKFLDYYKLLGNNYSSNHVILSEGIFDIYNEHIFDFTKLKNDVKFYFAGLSTSFESLIKSIVFNEQIFRLNVSILSDRNVNLDYYKKIKNMNKHIIDKITIFYNKIGKDFGESPVIVEKFII